jgi:hypothetical protein
LTSIGKEVATTKIVPVRSVASEDAEKIEGPGYAARGPQPMDAGCEHTVLPVGVAGKFVVIAVGGRWTAGCCFASRDASVVSACS